MTLLNKRLTRRGVIVDPSPNDSPNAIIDTTAPAPRHSRWHRPARPWSSPTITVSTSSEMPSNHGMAHQLDWKAEGSSKRGPGGMAHEPTGSVTITPVPSRIQNWVLRGRLGETVLPWSGAKKDQSRY
ncbi:carotenoid dehydrogenase [Cutibacterium acnes JCM 18918]|nr:carotenoid dehydrogenase [Cutibacterium acnes JCM 18918]